MTTNPPRRRRSFPVKPEAIPLMEAKMQEKGFTFTTQEEMYAELAEKAEISSDTVKNVFNPQFGRNPQRNTIQSIAKVLGIDPADIVQEWNPPTTSQPEENINSGATILNRQIFQEMLDKQQELTSNPLINVNFEASQLYVPLGLIENKKQERRKDVTPELGSSLYQSKEDTVTEKFENDEFITKVLINGDSPKSQGKRIAIIGEPGAGKTTRLQQFADTLFNQNDENLVIWVSLADLEETDLESFLLNKWLKIAIRQREASEEIQNKLIEKFNEGSVWLLLDGLDEMQLEHNPSYWVNSQIKGWIESAKVILTCRTNVWESGNNYLANFDVYRNLDFSELQRDEFVHNFFSNQNLADELINALNRDGKEKIKDLVKNPLRLTLICYSWENHQGSLPETKSELYQECVNAFYQWKEIHFETTSAEKKSLNKALGKLAKRALEQGASKFRLTHRFICDVLGEPDEGLFHLALELGWLNRVGVAEENPNEQVYAFFHPSFQEYFASLTIDDWEYFISGIEPTYTDKKYRIFDGNIKEVAMYWIGREDISQSSRKDFIETLLNFNPGGIDNGEDLSNLIYILFENRAYSIAIELFAELPANFSKPDLLGKIVAVMCSNVFNYDKYKDFGLDVETSLFYTEAIKKLKSNNYLSLKIIDNLFETQNNVNLWIKYNALDLIDSITINSDNNTSLINGLFNKIEKRENCFIKWKFIDLAGKHISDVTKAQEILREIIHSKGNDEHNSKFFLINCLLTLEKLKVNNVDQNNILTIDEFLNIIRQTKNAKVCKAYLHFLSQKVLVTSEDLNKLFAFVIDLVCLKDEYIEQQFPEDNNYQFDPEGCDEFGEYYGCVESSVDVIHINNICLDIAKKVANKNKNDFSKKILKKIENILKTDIDFESEDFRYSLSSLSSFEILRLYYELNETKTKNKNLFLILINCLTNQQKFIAKRNKVDLSPFASLIYEIYVMCGYIKDEIIDQNKSIIYELNDIEKENLVETISSIIHIVIDKNSSASNSFFLLRLSKIWSLLEPNNQEVLNYIEHFTKLDQQEKEKYSDPFDEIEPTVYDPNKINKISEQKPDKKQFEELKEKISIDFVPNNCNDIVLLTNYLLFENISEQVFNIYLSKLENMKTKNKGELALYNLTQTSDPNLLQEIVSRLKLIFISPQIFDSIEARRQLCLKALWHCANRLSYQEFSNTWFSVSTDKMPNIHPEVVDYTSIGSNIITEQLNQNILNLFPQLQSTDKTCPVVINAQSLEDENNEASIAQELCNQIYTKVFPDKINIPEANNAPQLKRLIPNLKRQLNIQNIALIFHNGEPNEISVKFCKKITDIIHIKWITEQPIAYGIPPQDNLINILQNWINNLE